MVSHPLAESKLLVGYFPQVARERFSLFHPFQYFPFGLGDLALLAFEQIADVQAAETLSTSLVMGWEDPSRETWKMRVATGLCTVLPGTSSRRKHSFPVRLQRPVCLFGSSLRNGWLT